ncbi:MAG: TonB-dependent receptor [Hyphomicrobium sp.]
MSLNEFGRNPFQEGCATAASAAAGCAKNNFSATGNNAVPRTAGEVGANRDDRRTIGGVRWEHEYDAETSSRFQFVIDDRDISQPTGTTSAVGDYLSYNAMADVTHRTLIAGLPATYLAGAFWNYLPVDSYTYLVAPDGNATLGKLQSNVRGSTTNFGARAREEVSLTDTVVVAAGITVERSLLEGSQRSYTYNPAGQALTERLVSADRSMTNVAPEVGLLWRPSREWQYRARIGTGYGTPQFTNLFVTSAGGPGNNTDLKSQENVGLRSRRRLDAGARASC